MPIKTIKLIFALGLISSLSSCGNVFKVSDPKAGIVRGQSQIGSRPPSDGTSGPEVINLANANTNFFTNTVRPRLMAGIGQIRAGFSKQGYNTCAQITSMPDMVDYKLDDTTLLTASAGNRIIPTEMFTTGITSKKFVFKKSGVNYLEFQIACNGDYEVSYYRHLEDSKTRYEFWLETDKDKHFISFGAMDLYDYTKYTYFHRNDGTNFETQAVILNHPIFPNISLAMVGINNQKSIIAIARNGFVDAETISPFSASLPSYQNIKHCYSLLDNSIDNDGTPLCDGLTFTHPTADAVRGGSDWSLSQKDKNISTLF